MDWLVSYIKKKMSVHIIFEKLKSRRELKLGFDILIFLKSPRVTIHNNRNKERI